MTDVIEYIANWRCECVTGQVVDSGSETALSSTAGWQAEPRFQVLECYRATVVRPIEPGGDAEERWMAATFTAL